MRTLTRKYKILLISIWTLFLLKILLNLCIEISFDWLLALSAFAGSFIALAIKS